MSKLRNSTILHSTMYLYPPAHGAVVGELLEAGEAADQAAGAPAAAEEAEDRPDPSLGLDLVLHPRHHLHSAI